MKILVICQYYYPEPFRISDVCEELVRRGHEVSVVTGVPNYPMGNVYEGYRHGEKRDEVINGVKVHRCYTVRRSNNYLYRILNYLSYPISSKAYIQKTDPDFDVVFVNQLSPVIMANAGISYAKKHKKKLLLYCFDLWPESLIVGGVKRGSLIYKIIGRISKSVYLKTDKIAVTSHSFTDYFRNTFGITDTEYLPQYAERVFTPDSCRKEPDDKIDLMFAGNLGAAQSLPTIIRTAANTKDISALRWHIVGDGSEYDNLRKLAGELGADNVIFHGRHALEEMPAYYSMADAMLITMQKDDMLSMTLPGKVQTYMAAGKPIIGAIDGETYKTILDSDCGYCCDAEDPDGLERIVRRFIQASREERAALGINGYNYYNKYMTKEQFISRMESILASLCTE